jgi:hypothetical protein
VLKGSLDHNIEMKFTILLYTHSEYSFLWKAAIPLLEKYAKGFEIVWCCDQLLDYNLPSSWILYKYDDTLTWSSRVKGCIDTLQETDYILYLQEDWLLIDTIQEERIKYCMNIMSVNNIDFLSSQNKIPHLDEIHDTPYSGYKLRICLGYWLQPAIWKKSVLYELVSFDKPLSKAEKEEPENLMNHKFCVTIFHKNYVNNPSTRSFYYPHMHAINGGQWTFNKYPCLKALVESYGIDTSTRTVNEWWHLHEE